MNLITVTKASVLLNCTRQNVVKHIKSGNLWAEKVNTRGKGWHYIIRLEDIEKLRNLKAGRKKGKRIGKVGKYGKRKKK